VEIDEKDQKIRDLKDLLYKAHLKITYLHQENMELRHNVSQETIPVVTTHHFQAII